MEIRIHWTCYENQHDYTPQRNYKEKYQKLGKGKKIKIKIKIRKKKKKNSTKLLKMKGEIYTWIKSIAIAKTTFAASVKKLTLMGLNMNFPSTLDIKTNIGCTKRKQQKENKRAANVSLRQCFSLFEYLRRDDLCSQILYMRFIMVIMASHN